jgi:hypothetical protein
MYVIHWIDPMIENKAREIVYDKIRQEGIQIPQKNRLQNIKKKKKTVYVETEIFHRLIVTTIKYDVTFSSLIFQISLKLLLFLEYE